MSDPSRPRLPRTWPAWCAAVLDLDRVAADRVASDLREFTRELPATT